MFFILLSVATSGIAALEYFDTMLGGSTGWLRWARGLVLPAAWAIWSAALLYHRFDPTTVVIVLLGSFALLVVVARLRRGRSQR